MIRVCVVCEGPTEADFVRSVLREHLWADHGIHFVPSIIKSSPGATGGGNVSVERHAKHMAWEYRSFDAVTSFVDWYGFKDRDVANKIFEASSGSSRGRCDQRAISYQKPMQSLNLH